MTRLASVALALACLLAGTGAAADYRDEWGNAWLGERLERDRPGSFWTDLVARPPRQPALSGTGPRTWVADDENPWANTFGTPSTSRWRSTNLRHYGVGVVRVCSCYLPADARSWDGGPLTAADVSRMCHAQCY